MLRPKRSPRRPLRGWGVLVLGDRPWRRYPQLLIGIALLGVSVGLQVRSSLGVTPWDVLHQGLSRHTGIRLGDIVIGVSVIVMLLWIPLRERPGVGTLCNTALLGVFVNWSLTFLPVPHELVGKILLLVAGVIANGIGTSLYVGAGLGPGPRDGLMTALARRGYSLRLVRTGIEATALVLGWILGGTVGVGTIIYMFGIGPAVHQLLPRVTVPARKAA
jgi:uncharacterized membrane protein YczE